MHNPSALTPKTQSLESIIEAKLRASLMQEDIIEINDLYNMVLYQMERPLLRIILEKTKGNQLHAAKILGINRNTLRKKMATLGITPCRTSNGKR
ncbi:MAG: helix-turn-helix domain-containing protein [Desulfuromonadaceae bacterium]|jgi:two-component system nitrogen regulation response regulator GlnG|nr:helix-turn-helix domain-containing protein [Desulfuromonas sp.]MDY0185708.1 helix-turn-helix domain-containing protein [Desulfuromonadaceae bacterium]